jgi:hypothetical protein
VAAGVICMQFLTLFEFVRLTTHNGNIQTEGVELGARGLSERQKNLSALGSALFQLVSQSRQLIRTLFINYCWILMNPNYVLRISIFLILILL